MTPEGGCALRGVGETHIRSAFATGAHPFSTLTPDSHPEPGGPLLGIHLRNRTSSDGVRENTGQG